MRAVWIDAGNDPDYAKLAANGIGGAYFDIRDPRLNVAYLRAVQGKGLAVGVYADCSWWPHLSGAAFASEVSRLLQGVAPNTTPSFPMVMLDVEVHDSAFILAALRQWRKHRTDIDID